MEKKETKDIDYNQKLKQIQLQILDKLGSGGLNQNDLMAIMGLMQRQETNTFGEIMPMIVAMKMLNPTKQDQTTPMFLWMMLDGMRKTGGNSNLEKRIDELQRAIEKKEEDSKFKEVMQEIKEMQKSREHVGIKDIVTILQDAKTREAELKEIAQSKDKELLVKEFQGQIGNLAEEIRKLQSGSGDISRVSETVKAIKDLYSDLGLEKTGQKSKEEVLKDLVETTAKAFAPAVNNYVEMLSQRQQQLTPQQLARIHQIQSQRANPPTPPTNPEVAIQTEPNPETGMQVMGKDVVFPELIDISSGPDKIKKK
ncbi:MAG: hypothetical protein ACTSUF_03495 [Candidatus Heimdallarchaeaceae archaeon]